MASLTNGHGTEQALGEGKAREAWCCILGAAESDSPEPEQLVPAPSQAA